ncbi:MAG: hypothetical protein ACPGU1_08780 [Myxococcota bacterium]
MRSSTCIFWLNLTALGVGLMVGCAEVQPGEGEELIAASPDDSSGTVISESDAPSSPITGDGPSAPAMTPLEALTVDAGLSDDAPTAGEVVQIYCTVGGLADGQEPPATSWRIVSQPDGSEAGVQIDGDLLTVTFAGVYGITCEIDATGWTDPTPAILQISPAAAVEIETELSPAMLTAGDDATVLCTGVDDSGNSVTEGWSLIVTPKADTAGTVDGVDVTGLTVTGLTQGGYEVACAQPDGSHDTTPALLTVMHGLPHTLVTTLEHDLIEAGDSAGLTCQAQDQYGNEIPDFLFSVAPLDHVAVVGMAVTSHVAGTYVIRCVPGDLGEWSAYVLESALLEVVPGPPVSLSIGLQPPKPYFATYELIQLVIQPKDAFDNHVPDTPVSPVEVGPGDVAHHMPEPTAILFMEDGTWTVTARLEEDPEVSDTIEIPIDGSPPSVTVTHPLRGATIVSSKPSVTVKGIAADEITGVQSVTVNGQSTTLDASGEWSTILVPVWGLNIIVVEVLDGEDQLSTITQSFYFAEKYHPMDPNPELVPDAVKGWMDEAFIDDGVHDPSSPDDLATIMESVLVGMDLGGMLPGGVDIGAGYELQIGGVNMGAPHIGLDSVEGGLDMTVDIDGIYVGLKLKGECKVLGIDLCPDFSGSVNVSQVQMTADLALSAWKGEVEVALNNAQLNLGGIDVDVDGILGWLFDWLIDFVVGLFADTIEDTLQSQIDGLLGDTMSQLIAALNITETVQVSPILPGMAPISMTVEAMIWNMNFKPDGGRVGLASRITTAKQVPQVIHGAISRGTCLKGYTANYELPGEAAFEGALYDDFVNQAVTAMWYSGAMNVSLDEAETAGILGDGEGLPLPVDGLTLNATLLLPPILNGCEDEGLVTVQMGDVFIDMTIDSPLFGDDGALGAYISTEITAEFALVDTDDGKAIGIMLHEIADISFHWEYVPEFFIGSEDVLEELIQTQLLGDTLDSLTQEPIFTIKVPEIDLGALTPIVPLGTMITPVIESLEHTSGHTLFQGYLE